MDDSRVFAEALPRSKAGTITKIRLENFMCHSSLEIELGEYVNFITGQNGSGKSAILTALCVAFGCRASGTQRASTLKEFIKNGCSSAVILVELKNCGEDAFRPEIYGDIITIERRISESTSSTVLKDHQGRKLASRKEELRELVEHFNIDVENPCVVMSQDKSREFLHSGNSKDKFKFFFKATLLQQVNELLQNIRGQLESAEVFIEELEKKIGPILKELNELHGKIKNMERLEEISQRVKQLKKKLAWAIVYDVDRDLQKLHEKIGKLKERIPACQAKIDEQIDRLDRSRQLCTEKKFQVDQLMGTTSEVKKRKVELQEQLSSAKRRRQELDDEHGREAKKIEAIGKKVCKLQQEVHKIQEEELKNTQDKEFQTKANVTKLEHEVNEMSDEVSRLKENENNLLNDIKTGKNEIQKIVEEIKELEKKQHEIRSDINALRRNQSNKVTAFGGDRVIHLLRKIEERQNQFRRPPVGPIGAHLTLKNGNMWASAVENAIGKLLNAFIVTNHGDSLVLKRCAKDVNYNNIQIFIYDFSRPRLNIPDNMCPQTNHPTTLSEIQADNVTVLNVLVDMGNVERQVLVKDYEVGKMIAFDRSISNVKEVFTSDGFKMFSRGSVQTILPPNKKMRTGRLCNSFEGQIEALVKDAKQTEEEVNWQKMNKRDAESALRELLGKHVSLKETRVSVERDLVSKECALKDMKISYAAEARLPISVDELHQEILALETQMREKGGELEDLKVKLEVANEQADNFKSSLEHLCESAKKEISALEDAEAELVEIESKIQTAEDKKVHYEGVMENKVLYDINVAEEKYRQLEYERNESSRKASIICAESEIQALGEWDGSTAEQLTAQLERLNRRLQQESQQYSESIDDLRMIYEKKQRKISSKQDSYKAFREKLNACRRALDSRMNKFRRNATLLKQELTWHFNRHLNKKGISGQIKVNYDEKTLSVEVKMPQDASSNTVRDTRGLSGGERSFSTMCFALALHGMIEAPFRAMDEFDVFMDAVSRRISLDTLIEFALMQGSQWIFITPHDISMVKPSDKVKKQQMAAPRA